MHSIDKSTTVHHFRDSVLLGSKARVFFGADYVAYGVTICRPPAGTLFRGEKATLVPAAYYHRYTFGLCPFGIGGARGMLVIFGRRFIKQGINRDVLYKDMPSK